MFPFSQQRTLLGHKTFAFSWIWPHSQTYRISNIKYLKKNTWFSNSLRKRSPLHRLHLYLRGCTFNFIFLINCYDQNIFKKSGSKSKIQVNLTPNKVKTIHIKDMNLRSPQKYIKKYQYEKLKVTKNVNNKTNELF